MNIATLPPSGNGPITMSSREIARLTGKRHSDVMRDIRVMLENLGIAERKFASTYFDRQGKVQNCYELPKREAILLASGYDVHLRAKMYDRIEELEAARQSHTALPNFADPISAARAWADQYEARMIAERTKAEIGSRREATAMNTAMLANKKARELQARLDGLEDFASVKRMEKHYKRDFPWFALKKYSIKNEVPFIEVTDVNYGKVNAYHADVWKAVYDVEVPHSMIGGAQ